MIFIKITVNKKAMYIFLSTFFTLYGLLHLYLFFKVRRFFGLHGYLVFLVITILALLYLMPLMTRVIERRELFSLARVTAYIGYTWMAGIFLFFILSFTIDLLLIVIKPFCPISYKHCFMVALSITVILILYGYYEAKTITVEELKIKTAKLPKHIEKLKIVQISDLHLGLIIREKKVEKILSIIKNLNPDIIVATGDIVDGQTNDILQHIEIFADLRPPLGKYAITGNHEYYAGINQSVSFIEKSGFKMLRGSFINVANIVNIAGVDDISSVEEREILSKVNNNLFTLFLKHRPLVKMDSIKYFDIQLSGHTHKGQIFPFYYVTKLAFPLNTGLYELKEGSFNKEKKRDVVAKTPLLYTSRGTGTWGPPIRILAPPEITLIELENVNPSLARQ